MTIFTCGKFDLLHPGHFNLLTYCRHMATYKGFLIVGIDSDERIRQSNPDGPVFPQDIRYTNLRILKVNNSPLIDTLHVFNSDAELHELIKSVSPDMIIKGSEWKGKPVIGEDICKVHFYEAEKNGTLEKISSSTIIQTILSHGKKQSVQKMADPGR